MTEIPNEEPLIEAACTAWRQPGLDGTLRAHAAWYDLSDEARLRLHDLTTTSRILEAALDSAGFSTTVRAVLSRIGIAA